jgi:cellulase
MDSLVSLFLSFHRSQSRSCLTDWEKSLTALEIALRVLFCQELLLKYNANLLGRPTSHHGPVIDYLANCHGPCETVDKTTLEFFKIDQLGLLNPSVTDGYWATDVLIANNNSWTVEIPPSIATGNYVLRHEIIALHAANSLGGAQNYPQCVSLAITSSGTTNPSGELATSFYSETDPGIYIDIYATLTNYTIPGPPLYTGAVTVSQTLPPTPTASSPGISSVA